MDQLSLLTPTSIQRCKQLLNQSKNSIPGSIEWTTYETQLYELLDDLACPPNPLKPVRLKYFQSGIYQEIVLDIIGANPGKHLNDTVRNSWLLVSRGMSTADLLESDQRETIAMGVEAGFVELAIRELKFRPLRDNGRCMDRAFRALTATAAYSQFVNYFINAGGLLASLNLLRDEVNSIHHSYTMKSNLVSAIASLNLAARHQLEVVKALPNIIEVIQPYLPLLRNHNDDEDFIVLGFSAARLLLRVFQSDQSSIILADNPIILDFYPTFIRKLLDVGPTRNYSLYGGFWSVTGLALDVSIIAQCGIMDDSKLCPLITLVIEMILYHHNNDYDLIRYGMIFLAQICIRQDLQCLTVLQDNIDDLRKIQQFILGDRLNGKETLALLDVVMSVG
jgi:hypothetical protein